MNHDQNSSLFLFLLIPNPNNFSTKYLTLFSFIVTWLELGLLALAKGGPTAGVVDSSFLFFLCQQLLRKIQTNQSCLEYLITVIKSNEFQMPVKKTLTFFSKL